MKFAIPEKITELLCNTNYEACLWHAQIQGASSATDVASLRDEQHGARSTCSSALFLRPVPVPSLCSCSFVLFLFLRSVPVPSFFSCSSAPFLFLRPVPVPSPCSSALFLFLLPVPVPPLCSCSSALFLFLRSVPVPPSMYPLFPVIIRCHTHDLRKQP